MNAHLDPIAYFNAWYKEETDTTTVRLPASCCLSTVGLDGLPNARFVALKDVTENGFIVTGSVTSRKGIEIAADNKVALTFWWAATERQVRIQGTAVQIPPGQADTYFSERNRDSQIVSIVSEQGHELDNPELLAKKYEDVENLMTGKELIRPDNWGGWLIEPVRMEFLAFQLTRFHERRLYELTNGEWLVRRLQP